MTTSSQTTRTTTKIPAGWTKVAAGYYRHPETGTEIINTWGGRKVSGWWVCVPPAKDAYIHAGAEGRCPIVHDCKNLAAAFAAAEPAIARTRDMIAKAWTEAHRTFDGPEPVVADAVTYASRLYEVTAVSRQTAEVLIAPADDDNADGTWVPMRDVTITKPRHERANDESVSAAQRQRAGWALQWAADDRTVCEIQAYAADPTLWDMGQADDDTVAMRHAARRDGWLPRPVVPTERGQAVRHVELGTLGVFDRHADGGAYVWFVDSADPWDSDLVHSDDVVRIDLPEACRTAGRFDPSCPACAQYVDADAAGNTLPHVRRTDTFTPRICAGSGRPRFAHSRAGLVRAELLGPDLEPMSIAAHLASGDEVARIAVVRIGNLDAVVTYDDETPNGDRLYEAIKRVGYELGYPSHPYDNLVDDGAGIMLWWTGDPKAHAEALEIHRRLMDSNPTLSGLRAVWADRPDVEKQLDEFERKCEPGARLWVYGYPWSFAVTATGLVPNHLELIFGGSEADGGSRFVAPLIAYRRDDTGETGTVGPTPAVTRGFASLLWTVLDADGLVIDTGLDSVTKAKQVADGHPGSTARLGLPTDRGYDVHADDGLGFRDPDVAARYAADAAEIRRRRRATEGEPLPEPALRLPVACLRTEHYGMEINILGVWLPLAWVGPVDPATGDVELAAGGRSGTIAATAVVELRPGLGPDDTQTPDPDPDPDPASPPCANDADPGPDPAALGYRVQTQTDGRWHTVQTGPLPPTFPPVQSGLTAAAETVLGNVGPVLGLGPRDRCPNVRVQTWDRRSGRTASTTRYA